MSTSILDNKEDEKAEDTSLIWDHSMGSFLLGQQSEDCHSTPKPTEPLCNNELENNQKHYENTTEISGLQNSRNEMQEEITSAKEANQARMQMLLRNREQLKESEKYKDFV